MHRNITPLFILLATMATAQPVILNGDNLPGPGFSVERREGNTQLPEGPAGAAQTWDFSSVYLIYNSQPYIVLDPATSPYITTWPGADYVASYSDSGDDNYDYFNVLPDRLEVFAEYISNLSSNTIYTSNPRTKLKFPFAYGETVTDTYTDPFNTQTISITYDAYGTLTTPTNVFENAVRIKWRLEWNGGAGDYRYDWWTLDPLLPVFQYTNGYVVQWASPGTGIQERAGTGTVDVRPNPFTDHTTINIDAVTLANKAMLTLSDITGQVVLSTPLTSTTTLLERGKLANGLYLYQVQTTSGTVSTGRVILN